MVNLTKALDVRVQLDENVVNANSARFTLFNAKYQTDRIEGKILIMNHKSEEIVVVINVLLVGKMNEFSIKPKKDITKTLDTVVNQQHDIRWEVTIPPRKSTEINYVRLYSRRV